MWIYGLIDSPDPSEHGATQDCKVSRTKNILRLGQGQSRTYMIPKKSPGAISRTSSRTSTQTREVSR